MQSRRAELRPQLDLRRSAERRAPAYARVDRKIGTLGNGFLEAQLDLSEGSHATAVLVNKASGETHRLGFCPFEVWLDDTVVTGDSARFSHLDARGSADVASLTSHVSFEWFDAELSYVLDRGDHFIRKLVFLRNFKKPASLKRVTMFKHEVSPSYEVFLHDGGMYYPIVFIRSKKGFSVLYGGFPWLFCLGRGAVVLV